MCVRSDMFPGWGCWQDTGPPADVPALVSLSPGQIHVSSVGWPSALATTRPSKGPFLPMTVAAFASSPAALAIVAVPPHPQEARLPAPQGRPLADGGRGTRARRADGVNLALGLLLVPCAA